MKYEQLQQFIQNAEQLHQEKRKLLQSEKDRIILNTTSKNIHVFTRLKLLYSFIFRLRTQPPIPNPQSPVPSPFYRIGSMAILAAVVAIASFPL